VTTRRHGSLLLPLALIFVGVMFLLINLGVIERSIWPEIVRYWPVLLVLMGVDLILRRSSVFSALASALLAVVLIAMGAAAFAWFAPEAWLAEEQPVSYPLGAAVRGEIVLSCENCSLQVHEIAGAVTSLVKGSVMIGRGKTLTESVQQEGNRLYFQLTSHGILPFLPWWRATELRWDIGVSPTIPVTLALATNAAVKADLSELSVESADIHSGGDSCTIILSRRSSSRLSIAGESVDIRIPEGVGVRVFATSSSTALFVPADFLELPDGVQSPGYESASVRSDITVPIGVKRVQIGRVESTVLP
jgi:hypothetical protein